MTILDFRDLRRRFPFLAFDLDTKLPRVRFVKDNAGLEFFLQGAHLSRFDVAEGGAPLFLSREAVLDEGKAIRGGVPICFPWFGPKKDDANAPSHGFARTMEWELVAADTDGVTLSLNSTAKTHLLWPHPFLATYRLGFEGGRLQMAFEVQNTGNAPFTFEVALHSYFRVSDVRTIEIDGLQGKTYLDQLEHLARKVQEGVITIGAETDRIYLDAGGPITLRDADRTVRISPLRGVESGWRSTVVWNPWIAKAQVLKDLGDDEWTDFVCIESGAIADNAVTLVAGESYGLAIEVEVSSGEN